MHFNWRTITVLNCSKATREFFHGFANFYDVKSALLPNGLYFWHNFLFVFEGSVYSVLINFYFNSIPKEIVEWVTIWGFRWPLILFNEPSWDCFIQKFLNQITCMRCCAILNKYPIVSQVYLVYCWK